MGSMSGPNRCRHDVDTMRNPYGEIDYMNDQAVSPRRRMQELLAIPDSRRTEEEWDELNELEISLASVNQIGEGDGKRPRNGAPVPEPRGVRGPRNRKPVARQNRRPPRPNPTGTQ